MKSPRVGGEEVGGGEQGSGPHRGPGLRSPKATGERWKDLVGGAWGLGQGGGPRKGKGLLGPGAPECVPAARWRQRMEGGKRKHLRPIRHLLRGKACRLRRGEGARSCSPARPWALPPAARGPPRSPRDTPCDTPPATHLDPGPDAAQRGRQRRRGRAGREAGVGGAAAGTLVGEAGLTEGRGGEESGFGLPGGRARGLRFARRPCGGTRRKAAAGVRRLGANWGFFGGKGLTGGWVRPGSCADVPRSQGRTAGVGGRGDGALSAPGC